MMSTASVWNRSPGRTNHLDQKEAASVKPAVGSSIESVSTCGAIGAYRPPKPTP